MGGNGSFGSGSLEMESGRDYRTRYSISKNIKVIELKPHVKHGTMPTESHTANRVYVTMKKDGSVTLTVPVTNTGKREGTETVQVYVKALDDAGAPIKALKGFQKLVLKAGETQTATITLDGEAFEYYDEAIDELSTKPGRYQILYGTSSLDQDLQCLDFTVM